MMSRACLLALALAVLGFAASLAIGPEGAGLPGAADAARMVLIEIRLPRAILGALVGAPRAGALSGRLMIKDRSREAAI